MESSNLNVVTVRSDPNLKEAPDVTGQSQNKDQDLRITRDSNNLIASVMHAIISFSFQKGKFYFRKKKGRDMPGHAFEIKSKERYKKTTKTKTK